MMDVTFIIVFNWFDLLEEDLESVVCWLDLQSIWLHLNHCPAFTSLLHHLSHAQPEISKVKHQKRKLSVWTIKKDPQKAKKNKTASGD
jgi:hypothetical protein